MPTWLYYRTQNYQKHRKSTEIVWKCKLRISQALSIDSTRRCYNYISWQPSKKFLILHFSLIFSSRAKTCGTKLWFVFFTKIWKLRRRLKYNDLTQNGSDFKIWYSIPIKNRNTSSLRTFYQETLRKCTTCFILI